MPVSSSTVLRKNILPGFSLSMGITLSVLGFFVLFPISAIIGGTFTLSFSQVVQLLSRPAAIAAFFITLRYAFFVAVINALLGFVIAWSIVRYKFLGSSVVDAIIDLPFALPGAVGGIALATVFGKNGMIGSIFHFFGIQLVYNQFGIFIGLLFVTLPFCVRSVQPLIQQLDRNEEQAARLLGANPIHIFFRVQLPALMPGIITGFILSFARSIGEYGTVIFVAGNIPLKSEVISRYIYNKIDQYDLEGAMAVSTVLLFISFIVLFSINMLQSSMRKNNKR